jgi:pyruvate-formate lyase
MDSQFEYLFSELRKTHNQGVFDAYSPDMLRCRKILPALERCLQIGKLQLTFTHQVANAV